MIKVFADYTEGHEKFDNTVSFSIERVSGVKLLRKYRKSYLINEYLNENKNVQCLIADHWKSLELIKTNKKKICLIHSKEINHPKGSRLNKKVLEVLNNVDHVVANSNYTKSLAIDLGVDENRIIVINPGVDPVTEIPKKDLSKAEELFKGKKQRLITVSRFDKRKNHEKVIMAVRNLKEVYPDIVYTCIGYGDEEDNLKKLVSMFELMSPEELNMIRNNDLNFLWNNLWKKTSNYKIYQKELKKSENNFNYLKNNKILEKLLEITPLYDSPEWGFPKGKRNNFEKNFDCAKREFLEETNINDEDHIILRNLYCINENYVGTNKLNYRHIYYISIADSEMKENNYNNNEVGEIRWFNWDDAINIIRPYYTSKIELLNKIFLFAVNSFEDITIDRIKKLAI